MLSPLRGTLSPLGASLGAAAVPFSPADLAGLTLWLKADGTLWQDAARTTPATADGDLIGSWDDASGNGLHVSESGATRPTLKTSIVNGKPVIRFSGSQTLKCNGFDLASMTLFCVIRDNTSNTSFYVLDFGAYGAKSVIDNFDSHKIEWYNSPRTTIGTQSTSVFQNINTDVGSSGSSSPFYVGSVLGSFGYVGDIAEVIIYNSVLSAGNKTKVNGYISDKYGI